MTYLYRFERREMWRRAVLWAAAIMAVFVVLWLLDRAAFEALYVGEERLRGVEGRDWYRTFRVFGTLWPWVFVCGALIAQGAWVRAPAVGERLNAAGVLIFLSAGLSGLVAEVLQVLTGRLRPNATGGATRFYGVVERFSTDAGMSFPSSHAAVAFGAGFMVWFLFPGAGVVALFAALLCGVTRLISGAHFLTDVFAAALVGYAMARLLRPGSWMGPARSRLLP